MSYLLPVLAVIIGFLIAVFIKPNDKRKIKLFLAFSGAFLLSVTVFEMMPVVFHDAHGKQAGVFIMLGILLQIFLEFFSRGAEHGHLHLDEHNTRFPIMLFLSLSIHSFLEGFPIHEHGNVVYGVLIHKMPVAIILSSFFIKSSISRGKTYLFLGLFALMTPLGTFTADYLSLDEDVYNALLALVVGIFLHISTVILFESSEGHKFNINKLAVIILGIVAAYFI